MAAEKSASSASGDARKDLMFASPDLPVWAPLSVVTFAAMMLVYHGIGYAFEWCDRTGHLKSAKVRDADRLSYRELLPRVLVNQFLILLPAMVLLQWAGLAFSGAAHFVKGLPTAAAFFERHDHQSCLSGCGENLVEDSVSAL